MTADAAPAPISAREARTLHWREYAIEAALLGSFMIAAAFFATALYHPSSPLAAAFASAWGRRAAMGLAMGATAVAIIYSPWGQRSGAHMNPAVTLTFFRLQRVERHDAVGYVLAQFAGGIAGITIAAAALRSFVAHPSIHYLATTPGRGGEAVAFAAEAAMAFGMMLVVLVVSNHPAIAHYTGFCAGLLVFAYITLETPLSGMSLNPARTLGPAIVAGDFIGLWIYFTAPPIGMLLAAELYVLRHGLHRVMCAKLHHPHGDDCHFGCAPRRKALKHRGGTAVAAKAN